jgi:2'-5' RNA ligase
VFAEWIGRLGTATGTPAFAPHITLVGSVPDDISTDTIGDALRTFAAFPVTFVSLADSADRYRCIAVMAAADPPLTEMRGALVEACGAESTPFDPHLSLLYAVLASDQRRALRDTIALRLPLTVAIDAVALVDTGDGAQRWTVSQTWRL